MGRLILIATASKWNLSLAEEELGNALYPYDTNITIRIDARYPLLYIFSSKLEPIQAFQLIVREPPAYVERLIPVEAIYRKSIACSGTLESMHGLAQLVLKLAENKGLNTKHMWVEVKPRKYFIFCEEKKTVRLIAKELSKLGIVVARASNKTVKVEDTAEGIVVSIINSKWDRIRFWRLKRLRVDEEVGLKG